MARRILLPLDEAIARRRVVTVMVLMPQKEFPDTPQFDVGKIRRRGRKFFAPCVRSTSFVSIKSELAFESDFPYKRGSSRSAFYVQ